MESCFMGMKQLFSLWISWYYSGYKTPVSPVVKMIQPRWGWGLWVPFTASFTGGYRCSTPSGLADCQAIRIGFSCYVRINGWQKNLYNTCLFAALQREYRSGCYLQFYERSF